MHNINTKNCKVENTARKITQNCVVHEDSEDIANVFNDYFVDIGKNIAESIEGNSNNHLDCMGHISTNLILFSSDQLIVIPLKKIICSLMNKSSDFNTIPVQISKSMCDIISPCLTNIINRSLTMHGCIS